MYSQLQFQMKFNTFVPFASLNTLEQNINLLSILLEQNITLEQKISRGHKRYRVMALSPSGV